MKFHVIRREGTTQRIQIAEATLREGHVILRHYYRTALPGIPRDRVITHTTRYECSCGWQWYSKTKPASVDILQHSDIASQL
jgi:hypothetical protein